MNARQQPVIGITERGDAGLNFYWEKYTERFRREMDCDICRKEMKRILDMSQTRDVYLVCYEKPGENCHRHILMELMMSYS